MPTKLTVTKCSLPVAGNVCFSITGGYYVTAGVKNDAAVAFATKKLALQNPQFIAWLKAYKAP